MLDNNSVKRRIKKQALTFVLSAMTVLSAGTMNAAASETESTATPETESAKKPAAETEAETENEEQAVLNQPYIVYFSGSDTRDEELQTSNSDVNVLMAVNPSTKNILLLNTPRDYYIPNPAGGNQLDKLTHCGNYGIDNSEKALEQLYDCSIDYYMQFNFVGFSKLIDAIGGIRVYSDEAFTTESGGFQIAEGYNELDGEQALAFVRDRYHVAYGDNGRGRDQMYVIQAVIDKISSDPVGMLSRFSSIMSSLNGTFRTDLEPKTMMQLLSAEIEDSSSWNVKTYAVTGHNGLDYTYSAPNDKNDVMYQDEELVAHASELIRLVEQGTSLTDEIVGETVQEW